jgi:pimeloyl-ACP methyl ester carboxylesterase
MWQFVSRMLGAAVVAVGVGASAPVFGMGLDPAFEGPAIGPAKAKGVIVWSHGRSINAEDSESPSPAYLTALRDDSWDVMRFDRMSHGDTLSDSTKRLVDYTAQLKHDGYKQVVLAGQSFGAFLSLMAADSSSDVDAVVATAPAAYGSFDDFYDSWRLNATRLYPLLERVKRARTRRAFACDPVSARCRLRHRRPARLFVGPLGLLDRSLPAALRQLHPRLRE